MNIAELAPAWPAPGPGDVLLAQDRGDDMSEDALVESVGTARLVERMREQLTPSIRLLVMTGNVTLDQVNKAAPKIVNDLIGIVLPIVEDYVKAERKAGAVDALRELRGVARRLLTDAVIDKNGAREMGMVSFASGVISAAEIITEHIARLEAS